MTEAQHRQRSCSTLRLELQGQQQGAAVFWLLCQAEVRLQKQLEEVLAAASPAFLLAVVLLLLAWLATTQHQRQQEVLAAASPAFVLAVVLLLLARLATTQQQEHAVLAAVCPAESFLCYIKL